MRTQFLPTIVGAFVVAAVILLIAFVLYRFEEAQLEEKQSYVMYFEGSMQGLEPGSELTFRGIKVGEVIKIGLDINPKTDTLEIPVYVQLLQFTNDTKGPSIQEYLIKAIDEGLRGELYKKTLLSSRADIRLIYKEDSKAYFIPNPKYLEIPTVPTQESDIDISAALETAKETFKSIKKIADDSKPQLTKFLNSATGMTDGASDFINSLGKQVGPSTTQFNHTLQDVGQAADSVKELSKYLEQHPESLITGKK